MRDEGRAVGSDPFHHFKEALLLPKGEVGYLHFPRSLLAVTWTVDQRGQGTCLAARPAWLLRECGRREQVNGLQRRHSKGRWGQWRWEELRRVL